MKAIRFIQTILFFSICALTANGQSSYIVRVENDSLRPYSDDIYTLDEEFNNFMDKYAVKSYKIAYEGPGPAVYIIQSDSTIMAKELNKFNTKGITILESEQPQLNSNEVYKSSYLIKVDDDNLKPIGDGIFTQNEEFNTILELYKAGIYKQWIPTIKDGWLKDVYQLKTEIELQIEFLNAFIGAGFSVVEEDTCDPQTLNSDMGLNIRLATTNADFTYLANSRSVGVTIPYHTKEATFYLYRLQGEKILSQRIKEKGKTLVNLSSNIQAGIYCGVLLCNGEVIIAKQIVITD